MHPATLWSLAVDAHTNELRRRAEERRAPIRAAGDRVESTPVVIRLASAEDAPELARLEALDSKELGDGTALVGEYGGTPVAALVVESGHHVADPFHHTADVVRLLELRARQLRNGAGQSRRAGRLLRGAAVATREEGAAC